MGPGAWRGLRPAHGLGPAAQSFEHAHSARMVHLGTKALAGAAPPGPQSPLNGDLDLGRRLTLGACDLAVLGLGHKGSLAQSLDDADFGQGLWLPLDPQAGGRAGRKGQAPECRGISCCHC